MQIVTFQSFVERQREEMTVVSINVVFCPNNYLVTIAASLEQPQLRISD